MPCSTSSRWNRSLPELLYELTIRRRPALSNFRYSVSRRRLAAILAGLSLTSTHMGQLRAMLLRSARR